MIEFARPEGPVLVVGAAGMDIVGRATRQLEPGTSNPGQLRISHGGVARNVAENLARLGHDCTLITAVGEDEQGRQLLERAQAAGIDITATISSPGARTGAYLAVLDQRGELQLGLDEMDAIAALTPDALQQREQLFNAASVLVLDANLPPASLAAALELAARNDLPVAVDPTSRSLAPKLVPHLGSLWLLCPNEGEAEALAPVEIAHDDEASAITAARRLVAAGVDIVLITRAEFGVGYATASGSGHVPAVQTDLVDPTGAGDALLATVVFALLNDIPLDEAARLGVIAASLTLRTRGSVVPDLSLELLYDHLR